MALTEPLDLLTGFPGWCTSFDLMARQEQSRHASGRTRVKDFGQPLWRGAWVSRSMRANELDKWRALLTHAMVSQKTFSAWPSSRCWPIEHPRGIAVDLTGWVLETGVWGDGVWRTDVPWGANVLADTGTLNEIGDNDDTVSIEGFEVLRLSVGDMVQIGERGLYRVLEAAEGDPTGLFTIEPHLWPGTVVGQDVTLHRPACLMVIEPGSLSASADPRTGRGSVSFTAIEAR